MEGRRGDALMTVLLRFMKVAKEVKKDTGPTGSVPDGLPMQSASNPTALCPHASGAGGGFQGSGDRRRCPDDLR